jgi:branched-chain amino acid transport system permease protein
VVVPALTAALFARFTSFWIACLVGLAIGSLENILYYLQTQSWFPTDNGVALPGVQPLLVFGLMVVAMFVRGTSLPSRGELVEQRLPLAPRAERLWQTALVGTAVAVVALIVLPYDFRQALITSLLATIMCLSVVVITGFVGQISIVQLALAGISGFILSHLSQDHGVGFPAGMLIGAAGATVLGLVIAFSSLRVRGVSLAVVTLAAAVAIEQFVFLNSTWGGGTSSSPVPEPKLGIDLGPYGSFRGVDGKIPSPVFGFFVVALVLALGLFVANLRRSTLGQRMLAIRSNERAAAAAGINVRNVKLAAFGISSFIAGIAGALYGYNFSSVTVTRFSALTALSLIALAYVGGVTMVSGAIFAGLISVEALFPYAFEKWFGISGNWALLFAGVTLILTLVQNPDGVAGAIYRKRHQRKRRGAAAPRRRVLALTGKEL